jgi:hypothetical protein
MRWMDMMKKASKEKNVDEIFWGGQSPLQKFA